MTDVIRVRFPDWSLWGVPLLAHEFGHVVALATPEFQEYKEQVALAATSIDGHYDGGLRHLDEFFAAIFALYTFGPAFACSAVLMQLSPAEAYLPRGSHPTHQERAEVILETLRTMNDPARGHLGREGVYQEVLQALENCWCLAVKA